MNRINCFTSKNPGSDLVLRLVLYALFLIPAHLFATNPVVNLHVAVTGNDASDGTPAAPLRTIQRAAELAQPGETIIVHVGVYRNAANPTPGPFETPGTGMLIIKVWTGRR